MRRISRRVEPGAYRGWFKWAVLVGICFTPLFTDTWLNIQMRQNDYELSRLNRKVQALNNKIEETRVAEAGKEDLDQLQAKAVKLGLVPPAPQQIEAVYYEPSHQSIEPKDIIYAKAGLTSNIAHNVQQVIPNEAASEKPGSLDESTRSMLGTL